MQGRRPTHSHVMPDRLAPTPDSLAPMPHRMALAQTPKAGIRPVSALLLLLLITLSVHAGADDQMLGRAGALEEELNQQSSLGQTNTGHSPSCPANSNIMFPGPKAEFSTQRFGPFPGPIAWEPQGEKYLVMECTVGRASNRLLCFQRYLKFAGLLNRTLIVDTLKLEGTVHHYNWSILIDFSHLKLCYGPKAVMTTQEYMEQHRGQKLVVDALLCWNLRCPEHWDWWDHCLVPPRKMKVVQGRSLEGLLKVYGGEYGHLRAIFMGDITGRLNKDFSWMGAQSGLPFATRPECPGLTPVLPHPRIQAAAREFVDEIMEGKGFAAVHFRGGDFAVLCKSIPSACFSFEEVANFTFREVTKAGISNIVICSDIMMWQVKLMQKIWEEKSNGTITAVADPLLGKEHKELIGKAKEGHASYQKMIMAHSTIFIGTNVSTFSEDVERIRLGLGTASCNDTYIRRD